MAKYRSLGGILGPTLLLALLGAGCNNTQCENLRDELWRKKQEWSRCSAHTDCMKILGNPGDCTGIMSCNFAVNLKSRLEADRRIASLPEETVDCTECTSPNCVAGNIALCEPTSGRCILVTEILDGGTTSGDAGASGD
jgi:hypothetical protein